MLPYKKFIWIAVSSLSQIKRPRKILKKSFKVEAAMTATNPFSTEQSPFVVSIHAQDGFCYILLEKFLKVTSTTPRMRKEAFN